MLHFNVRRLTAAVALVLVLAAVPALAAPGPRPHATQRPVAGLSLLGRVLDWLGFSVTESSPGQTGRYEKSTAGTPVTASGTTDTKATLSRGAMVDPNG